MASPPTITVGNINAASGISDSVLYGIASGTQGNLYTPPASLPFRFFGAQPVYSAVSTYVQPGTLSTASVLPGGGIEFMHDGSAFELATLSGANIMAMVDGELVSLTATAINEGGNNARLVLYDFGSRAIRHIRLWGGFMRVGGVRIGPTDSIWRPHIPLGPRVIVMADSFGNGTLCFAHWCGWALGWRDVWVSFIGSTGYIAQGSAGVNFNDRVQADVLAYDPGIVIVAGGINDGGAGAAAIQAAAETLFDAILAHTPRPAVIAVGPWCASGFPNANILAARTGISAAATAKGAAYVDNVGTGTSALNTLGWMTGTGKVGATQGNGNADVYTSSDGTHPTADGQKYLGHRLAAAIGELMPL